MSVAKSPFKNEPGVVAASCRATRTVCDAAPSQPHFEKASTVRKAAIVGAGWAGCAAAVELAGHGWQISLFEAARTLGGRARKFERQDKVLDNGQHILLGAYRDSLAIMRKVGVDLDAALLRLPLQMCYPPAQDGMRFVAPRLPAPWHMLWALLRCQGLKREDKLALARFSTTARWMGWRLYQDCTVAELLERYEQTQRLCRLMWRPLCIAALNTPPERASAQVFLNVLRDSLGARRAASDMLIPKDNLSALFPELAAAYVQARSGEVRLGAAVKSLECNADGRWGLSFGDSDGATGEAYDAVIVATGVDNAARLLDSVDGAPALPSFSHEAITTCYLQYGAAVTLPRPLFALLDEPAEGRWGQFVFDRGQLDAAQAGLLAVVVSASDEASALGGDALAQSLTLQLAQSLQMPELAAPHWSQVVTEKRATFSCAPGLQRPENYTPLPGLLLAGDYTAGDYPATLEGAVRSGLNAARLCAASR